MNKTFYVLLCLISAHAFAGDLSVQHIVQIEEEELERENPGEGQDLEIQLEGEAEDENPIGALPFYQTKCSLQQPADVHPGSALDLSHELTYLCYGKKYKPNKFCRGPFEEHLRKLKRTDHQEYEHIATLIRTNKTERIQSAQQHRGIGDPGPTSVPIELMRVVLKALKEEDKLKTGAIIKHKKTSEDKDYTIKDLKTWGSRKNWGLAGTIGSCAFLVLGYFGYTISPC